MLVRRETRRDRDAIADLLADAFADQTEGGGEPTEVGLTRALFASDAYLPRLSLVAEEDGHVVGFVICTRGRVGAAPALGLGPLAVRPDRQGTGVGSALMHAVLGAADALDEPLVTLLGDPRYYGRFGFVPGSELGVEAPDPRWGENFQARRLSAWSPGLTGGFRYAAPFDDL